MKSKKTKTGAGSASPATAGSAGPLTADDINLIDKCLSQCADNLRCGAGFSNVVQMACIYTTERIAEVREKLKPMPNAGLEARAARAGDHTGQY